MAVEIRCRYATGTYVATVKGEKRTASNTISARHAAEAMATKLGLNPAHLVEEQRIRSGGNERVIFTHPGWAGMKALSVRQPWAWLIVHGHKPLENRSWATSYRGPLLIHAAKGMTRAEYEDAASLCSKAAVTLPAFEDLERGGIVGQVTVTGCIDDSPSLWFFGKYGFELAEAKPLPFMPCKGRLGLFDVEYQGAGS